MHLLEGSQYSSTALDRSVCFALRRSAVAGFNQCPWPSRKNTCSQNRQQEANQLVHHQAPAGITDSSCSSLK